MWVDPLFLERKLHGAYLKIVCPLRGRPARFWEEFHMTVEQFDFILERVTPVIQRQDTFYREAISPAERLAICLW